MAKPRAVLNLVDTRYYTQTRLPCECYWTRSSPMHRYIQKEVAIWELGRTRDTGTFETIVLTKWRMCP